jgi:hypothetical protein
MVLWYVDYGMSKRLLEHVCIYFTIYSIYIPTYICHYTKSRNTFYNLQRAQKERAFVVAGIQSPLGVGSTSTLDDILSEELQK